ncbi:50S ribosomal protein L6 [Candidatus Nomurabacteria bacterium]|nr:50S ribosomal protein L6 [Candidatus Nomurabacteria bacterium]
MSRIGKKPIIIPEKTEITISGNNVLVKGPLGTLSVNVHEDIKVEKKDNTLVLVPTRESIEASALWGTASANISNAIKGVNKAFEKKLIIEGVGYKYEAKGDNVLLNLGLSHPVNIKIPQGLKVTTEKGIMTISGIDKGLVGLFSAKIRDQKKPEPYKGKGIAYVGEVIRRKQGKKSI